MSDKLSGASSIVTIAAVIGAFIYLADMREEIATKTYHDADLKVEVAAIAETLDEKLRPIQQSADDALSNTLPPRILNILKVQCRSPEAFAAGDLSVLLDRLRAKYQRLNDRNYSIGECREGVYYNALGIRQD